MTYRFFTVFKTLAVMETKEDEHLQLKTITECIKGLRIKAGYSSCEKFALGEFKLVAIQCLYFNLGESYTTQALYRYRSD